MKFQSQMVEAICLELSLQKDFLGDSDLQSVYFGGGTPSILSTEDLQKIFHTIHENYTISPGAEITLEANPDDLKREKLLELWESPINRLSIGIQSFRDQDLKLMNRSHNAHQSSAAVAMAREVGFSNISIDLIYAIPGQDDEAWQGQIEQALKLNVPHISAYSLTVEEKTILDHQIKTGMVSAPDEDTAARHFELLWKQLEASGYEHYEVSNFARPEMEALHNSSYWKNQPYLGVGPAAHSYKPGLRQWNISNNPLYIQALKKEELPFEKELLSTKDEYNEWIMTGLRRKEGLDLKILDLKFPPEFRQFLRTEVQPLLKKKQLTSENGRIYIPREHRFHSDGIASALFYI